MLECLEGFSDSAFKQQAWVSYVEFKNFIFLEFIFVSTLNQLKTQTPAKMTGVIFSDLKVQMLLGRTPPVFATLYSIT